MTAFEPEPEPDPSDEPAESGEATGAEPVGRVRGMPTERVTLIGGPADGEQIAVPRGAPSTVVKRGTPPRELVYRRATERAGRFVESDAFWRGLE